MQSTAQALLPKPTVIQVNSLNRVTKLTLTTAAILLLPVMAATSPLQPLTSQPLAVLRLPMQTAWQLVAPPTTSHKATPVQSMVATSTTPLPTPNNNILVTTIALLSNVNQVMY